VLNQRDIEQVRDIMFPAGTHVAYYNDIGRMCSFEINEGGTGRNMTAQATFPMTRARTSMAFDARLAGNCVGDARVAVRVGSKWYACFALGPLDTLADAVPGPPPSPSAATLEAGAGE